MFDRDLLTYTSCLGRLSQLIERLHGMDPVVSRSHEGVGPKKKKRMERRKPGVTSVPSLDPVG